MSSDAADGGLGRCRLLPAARPVDRGETRPRTSPPAASWVGIQSPSACWTGPRRNGTFSGATASIQRARLADI